MPERKPPKVKVEQKEGDEVPKKVLARAIVDISKGIAEILGAGLEMEDLVRLISRRKPGLSLVDIRDTIAGLEQLRRDYTK